MLVKSSCVLDRLRLTFFNVYSAERAYVIVLILALTQGPVYRIWYASGASTALVPNPPIVLAHYATFLAVQVPGLILLGRYLRREHVQSVNAWLMLVFLAWMSFSVLWSTLSRQSIIEALSLVTTACCALYLVVRFSIEQRLWMTYLAMQGGVTLSIFAVARNWTVSVSESEGYWIGIYLNRNSLAPVTAIGMLAGAMLLPKIRGRTLQRRRIGQFVVAGTAILDAYVLWRSESTTSVAALALATCGAAFWLVVRVVSQRSAGGHPFVRYSHFIYIISVSLGIWFLLSIQGRVLTALGQTTDFSGRLAHWRFSWNGFLANPFVGYGWQAAWRDPEFLKGPGWWALPNVKRIVADSGSVSLAVDPDRSWSHSGYFDVLLGGGVVAGIVMIALLVSVVVEQRHAVVQSHQSVWNMAVVWFVVAAASQESFIVGNHFLWLCLATALWTATSPEQQDMRATTARD